MLSKSAVEVFEMDEKIQLVSDFLVSRFFDFFISFGKIFETLSKQLPFYFLVVFVSYLMAAIVHRQKGSERIAAFIQFVAVSGFGILVAYVERRVGTVYGELFTQGLVVLGALVQSIGALKGPDHIPINSKQSFAAAILFLGMFFLGAELWRTSPPVP